MGLFCCCFNAFFTFRAKHQIIFLPNKQEFGRIFSSTTFIREYFPSSILKINLCTSRRIQLQQCLFCYFELIMFVCIDILHCCQHFWSHGATFPCPPRLNQYLAENKVSCLGHNKVLPVNLLKIAILQSQALPTSSEQLLTSII